MCFSFKILSIYKKICSAESMLLQDYYFQQNIEINWRIFIIFSFFLIYVSSIVKYKVVNSQSSEIERDREKEIV